MSLPRWTVALLQRVAPADRVQDLLGDLEEAHARRVARRGRVAGALLTAVEAVELAWAVVRTRGGWRPMSWLDLKLGVRMLARYPGITIVGGLAIAFAIWTGAGLFELTALVARPDLRLPGWERLVGVRLVDLETGRIEPRVVHDLAVWRERAPSLVDWGAYRTTQRNLIVGDGPGEPTSVAEMTASGFTVAGVPPLLGRTLAVADEAPGAAPVAVIGHDLWRSRFAGDPQVLGRTLRLGGMPATVVGVMPEGFGFPLSHRVWIPLRTDPLSHGWRDGPGIQVFARLAPGATMAAARAELEAVGAQLSSEQAATHAHLRVELLPYARAALNLPPAGIAEVRLALASSNLVPLALLLLICSNVALLMFARAAARQSELVVRSALGASRRRIVGQLFAEALVLGLLGAALGLAATRLGVRWVLLVVQGQMARFGQGLPFWFDDRLSGTTVAYALVLTVIAAAMAGVLPALRITRGLGAELRRNSAGGGGMRFGGVWTAVIVTQVAVTVAFPAVAFYVRRDGQKIHEARLGVETERYLAARLEMDREPPPTAPADTAAAAFQARFRAARTRLEERLLADPAVVGVTYAERLPKMYHPWHQIEVDGDALPAPDERGHRMGVASIDPDYFDVLGVPVLAGRPFGPADVTPDARVVIVNQPFVDSVLGGKNPIGRRVRIVASESSRRPSSDAPWHEIVGLVPDVGTRSGYGREGVYRPARPEQAPMHVVVRLRGDPRAFAPTLLAGATQVDPTLRVHDVIRLDETIRDDLQFYRFWLRMSIAVSVLALVLSLAGVYAVMSFTVARRTREIGIRVALGSRHRRVLVAILARPLAQVGGGIAVGMAFVAFLTAGIEGSNWRLSALQTSAIAAYALLMTAVCLLACIVPARRALRVPPTDALRAEG